MNGFQCEAERLEERGNDVERLVDETRRLREENQDLKADLRWARARYGDLAVWLGLDLERRDVAGHTVYRATTSVSSRALIQAGGPGGWAGTVAGVLETLMRLLAEMVASRHGGEGIEPAPYRLPIPTPAEVKRWRGLLGGADSERLVWHTWAGVEPERREQPPAGEWVIGWVLATPEGTPTWTPLLRQFEGTGVGCRWRYTYERKPWPEDGVVLAWADAPRGPHGARVPG